MPPFNSSTFNDIDLPQDPGYLRIQMGRQDARWIGVVRWRRWLLTIASSLRRYESGFRGDQQSHGRNKTRTQCYEFSSLHEPIPFPFCRSEWMRHRGTCNASVEVSLAGLSSWLASGFRPGMRRRKNRLGVVTVEPNERFRSLAQITGIRPVVGYLVMIIVYYMAVLRWTTTNPGWASSSAGPAFTPKPAQTAVCIRPYEARMRRKPCPESYFLRIDRRVLSLARRRDAATCIRSSASQKFAPKNAAVELGIDCVAFNSVADQSRPSI